MQSGSASAAPSSDSSPTSRSLQSLLRADVGIDEIASHLDALPHVRRLEETRALTGRDQERLYQSAAKAPPLDLSFFVPDSVAPLREVVHHGRNSQPAFRSFQKRFCRPADREDVVCGYNETVVRPVIGPGYFVAHSTRKGGPDTEADPRGAVVVDYFEVPKGPLVEGWPTIRRNEQGLQRFVYHQTRDYMRRVSKHVSIGEAHRLERRVMGWFVLCREDL